MEDILPKIRSAFGNWRPGDIPEKNLHDVDRREDVEIYLIDRPDSEQSILFAGHIAPPKANPDEVAIEAVNDVLGGMTTSRINMNLREDKGWSYGAGTGLINARGQRFFYVITSVQTDKTSESIAEAMKEVRAIIGDDPITAAELEKSIKNNSLSLAGRWETAGSVLGSLSQIVQYGLPDDYWVEYPKKVANLSVERVNEVSRDLVQPGSLVWVVVGDRDKIAGDLDELGYGDVRVIDADGNLLEQ
ncbi:MAG: insulinase family protein [Gammaproteobacteria bacterium]|nr:insulinase family protein [Gammaproteobacteria bacterium]